MPCQYSEHVISCGHGGFTVSTRKPPCKHEWLDHWHMGYIIGRECSTCGKRQYKSAEWCAERQRIAEKT